MTNQVSAPSGRSTLTPDADILNETQLKEMEARLEVVFAKWHSPGYVARLLKTDMPALCRALRVAWASLRETMQVAERASTQCRVLQDERDRFSELADTRHEQLCEARRQRDSLAANHEAYTRDATAALREQLAQREQELSEAAREIAVTGPIAHRIRVLKQTYEECAAETEAAYKSRLAQVEKERDWFSKQCENLQNEVRAEAEQYEQCVTCVGCGRSSWHRKGDEPL